MVEVLNNKLSLGGYVPHKPSREIDLKEDNEAEKKDPNRAFREANFKAKRE